MKPSKPVKHRSEESQELHLRLDALEARSCECYKDIKVLVANLADERDEILNVLKRLCDKLDKDPGVASSDYKLLLLGVTDL